MSCALYMRFKNQSLHLPGGRVHVACLLVFSKLIPNLPAEYGTPGEQKHLLSRNVTLYTMPAKSSSMMFLQGIIRFFLPSQLYFSYREIKCVICVSNSSVSLVLSCHRNFSSLFDFTKQQIGCV